MLSSQEETGLAKYSIDVYAYMHTHTHTHTPHFSLNKLQDICYPDVDDQRWFSSLDATHWLDYIKVIVPILLLTRQS